MYEEALNAKLGTKAPGIDSPSPVPQNHSHHISAFTQNSKVTRVTIFVSVHLNRLNLLSLLHLSC